MKCPDDCSGGDGGALDGPAEASGFADSTGAFADTGASSDGGQCSPEPSTEDDDMIGETEGLDCGGASPLPQLGDARLFRVADLVSPPAELDPDGYLLVLSSLLDLCPDPRRGFDCGNAHEFRLFLGLPADVVVLPSFEEGLEFGSTDSGVTNGMVGTDIPSWIQVGQTDACCELTTPPERGVLFVRAFDPNTLTLEGEICNYYWTAELGYGLSGSFTTSPPC